MFSSSKLSNWLLEPLRVKFDKFEFFSSILFHILPDYLKDLCSFFLNHVSCFEYRLDIKRTGFWTVLTSFRRRALYKDVRKCYNLKAIMEFVFTK